MEKSFFIVAVKDELMNQFLSPTFGEDLEVIKRTFRTQINTISIWKENASDFSLYLLGFFNSETGEIKSKVEKICSGHSVLTRKENE